jgi:hypothetical protein
MRRTLKYGFFGEDEAMRIFLNNYLKTVEGAVFVEDSDFCSRFKGRDKVGVKKKFVEAAQQGLEYYGQEVFFVGIDLDAIPLEQLKSLYSEMTLQLHMRHQNRTIILIPIQAIEHWLLYLKERQKNPQSTKNLSFESKDRKQAKIEIYGHGRYNGMEDNRIVEQLSMEIDAGWLASQSASFKHFHLLVSTFIEQQGQ